MYGKNSLSKRSVGSIAMSALLLMGVVAILPLTNSAFAQTGTTITTSADPNGAKFFGPALLEVLISVSSHASDTAQGNIQATVTAFGGSNTYQLTETGTTSGLFLMYIKVDPTAAGADTPTTPFAPFSTTMTRLYVGPATVGAAYPATAGANVNAELAVNAANIVEGGSVQVSANGVSKTISWDDSGSALTLDRTSFGPGATIIAQIKDQDGNLDPTRAETITETVGAGDALLTGTDGPLDTVATSWTETGPNTANFELSTQTASALAVGQDSVSRSLSGVDFKAFSGAAPVVPNSVSASYAGVIAAGAIGSSTGSYTVQTQRGIFQALNATSYASELPLRITDLDRNTSSRQEQIQAQPATAGLRVTAGALAPALFSTRESGLNSNTLLPNYSGDDLDLTFNAAANDVTQGIVAITQGNDVVVEYLDVFFLRAAFDETLATQRLDLNGDGDSADTHAIGATINEANIRLDLDNSDTANTVAGIIEANTRVDLNGDGDFSDTFTLAVAYDENANIIRVNINGDADSADAAVAINTAVHERLIRIDMNNNGAVADAFAFIAGGNEANTIVDLDGIDLGGVSSKLTFQLSNTVATLTADKTTASRASIITLTLTDADLNDDSAATESYTTNFGASTAYTGVTGFANPVYDLRIRVSGTERNLASGAFSVTFTETGPNTGIFRAQVNLQSLTNAIGAGFAFTDGDTVQLTVRERLDQNVAVRPETTATVTIGLTKPTITVDRQTIGVPRNAGLAAVTVDGVPGGVTPGFSNLGTQVISITVVDPAMNSNSQAEDVLVPSEGAAVATSATGVRTLSGGRLILSLLSESGAAFTGAGAIQVSKAIKETGFDTGVFTGEIQVTFTGPGNSAGDNPATWIGSKLKIEWIGADNIANNTDDADSTSIGFTARNAIMTTDTTVVANGKSIVVSIRDDDANRDPATAEQVQVGIRFTDENGATQNARQTLDETGLNTGIFTKRLDIGTTTPSAGAILRVQGDTDFRLRYYDLTPSIPGAGSWPLASSTQTQIDLTLRTVSATGGLVLEPTRVGPATQIRLTVTDTDENVNPNTTNQITGRITAVSDRGAASRADVNADETGPNTGIFTAKVRLTPAIAANAPVPGPATDVTITALPGDLVSIRYEDNRGVGGQRTTVTKTVQVTAVDPVIRTDKTAYEIGATMTINLNDLDANRDPDTADIRTLRVTSTTDAVGLTNVQAIETGPNTGNFTATVQLVRTFSTGALQVSNGDNVTVEYTDQYPANFRQKFDISGTLQGSEQKFRVNATVGTAGTTGSTTPSEPALVNVDGSSVTEITEGQQVVITTDVQNNQDQPRPATVIVEVRNSDGITAYLQWQTATIAANGEIQVGLSWIPEGAGDYEIRTFVVSNLTTPQVLSDVVTSDITVS